MFVYDDGGMDHTLRKILISHCHSFTKDMQSRLTFPRLSYCVSMCLNIEMKVSFDRFGTRFSMKVCTRYFFHRVILKGGNSVLCEDTDPSTTADLIISRVVPLGQRFYPSESAFPLRMFFFPIALDITERRTRIHSNTSRQIRIS